MGFFFAVQRFVDRPIAPVAVIAACSMRPKPSRLLTTVVLTVEGFDFEFDASQTVRVRPLTVLS